MTKNVKVPVEPKPCPFCGEEPCSGSIDYVPGWQVYCECDQAEQACYAHADTEEDAIKSWNIRAMLAAAPADDDPAKRRIVCHAEGEWCPGCAHYRGEAEVCEFANQAADEELARLEREIATESAKWVCRGPHHLKGDWFKCARQPKAVRYLELRGLLERHPDNPTLVRVREGEK